MAKFTTGTSVTIRGRLVHKKLGKRHESAEDPQFEVVAESCDVVGSCDAADYPLQKKYHSLDFLREHLHLRPRSRTIGAMTRVRSEASFALQSYLRDRDFLQVHTPVLTSNDCEGAGELFAVAPAQTQPTPSRTDKTEKSNGGFFGENDAYLTVSGQLHAEMFACALGRVYTFGPTFRAENSQTRRHLAEFWMLEPEMAFATLDDVVSESEGLVRACLSHLLERCADDLIFFEEQGGDDSVARLTDVVRSVAENSFERMSYTDAVRALGAAHATFEHSVQWGLPLQTEHERWLTEIHCAGRPVVVTDYPAACKPFYMRRNDCDDAQGQTVAAFDLLVPGIGELVGGSEREERQDVLEQRMRSEHLLPDLQWYLDLRRFGTARHGGFGLGFERLLMFATGMRNIRDVIAIPRYPGFVKY
eukprot:g2301.t1